MLSNENIAVKVWEQVSDETHGKCPHMMMLNHTLVYFHWVCLHAHSFESYPGFEHEKLFYIIVDMIRLLITCRCVCFLNMSHFCLIRCFFLFHFSSVFLQTKIQPHPGFWSQVLTFTWETHNECSCLTLCSCSFNTAQIQTIQQHPHTMWTSLSGLVVFMLMSVGLVSLLLRGNSDLFLRISRQSLEPFVYHNSSSHKIFSHFHICCLSNMLIYWHVCMISLWIYVVIVNTVWMHL